MNTVSKTAKEVVYQTPDGKSAMGYIIDGKTYKDSSGTTRVDVGSTVPTAGGTYTLTPLGGVKTPSSIASDLGSAYRTGEASLRSVKNAKVDSINAATRKAQDAIKEQKKDAAKQYEDANRMAYQAYMAASNPYGAAGEQRAALGLANSGYSETSKMQLANTYQQALSENLIARDAYIRELDNAYREAKYNGDIALADAIAEYGKLVYQHGINAAEAIAEQERYAYSSGMDAYQDQWNRNVYEREYADQKKQEQWNQAYKLAQAGFSNQQIANILGVSLSELYRVVNG